MPVNIFGKKKTDDEKDRQIRELRVTFPSLRRPNNDDELFEMLFEVEKAYSTLRIYLKPEFPSLKPGSFQRHCKNIERGDTWEHSSDV